MKKGKVLKIYETARPVKKYKKVQRSEIYIVLQRLSSKQWRMRNSHIFIDNIFSFRVVNVITFIVKFIENCFQIKIAQFICVLIYKHYFKKIQANSIVGYKGMAIK